MKKRTYEEYEIACEKIRSENSKLLSDFEEWLFKRRLSLAVVKKHVDNIDFYVNEYLLYEDAVKASEGAGRIDMYLSYWFIKKAAWASPYSIRSNAASLKKFYAFMQEKGLITKEALKEVNETIKENMSDWIATVDRYDDPSITDPKDIWGF
jgi:hypothetical protein